VSLLAQPGRRLAAGSVAVALYGLRASQFLAAGQPANMLWACYVGALAVGFGLLLRSPSLNAIGFLWETVGVPAWLLDLTTGGAFFTTSLLTHLAGLVLGFLGVGALGLPDGAWWKALGALAALVVVTRWMTPPSENVNLAFRVWPGWERWFPSHGAYLLFLACLSAATFLAVSAALKRGALPKSSARAEAES
jgi:hypothetical protein